MSSPNIAILIGPYFDEESVVTSSCQLHKKGVPFRLVGLTSKLPTGLHGVSIRPHLSLNELKHLAESEFNSYSLLIPGSHEAVAVLLSDPRVYDLIAAIFASGNLVAAMLPAQQILTRAGIPSPENVSQFLAQNGADTAEFIQEIIEQVSAL